MNVEKLNAASITTGVRKWKAMNRTAFDASRSNSQKRARKTTKRNFLNQTLLRTVRFSFKKSFKLKIPDIVLLNVIKARFKHGGKIASLNVYSISLAFSQNSNSVDFKLFLILICV
ncbi:hypothetical protein BpHYR1_045370 [Brachionus plicatilis]|uniref:Uncharacterized protein n=1 Tax=Brachionus plicatilis TaxID=10195 RepID=A0A3M7S8F5_BRAPC|nr:hypothetical protein BpHYR1_045370 [Brachionus plicatilis]